MKLLKIIEVLSVGKEHLTIKKRQKLTSAAHKMQKSILKWTSPQLNRTHPASGGKDDV